MLTLDNKTISFRYFRVARIQFEQASLKLDQKGTKYDQSK